MTILTNDGDTHEFQGSGKKPYILKNTQGTLSCSCPAWRNQSKAIDVRTCKHLISVMGAESERIRTGDTAQTTKVLLPASTVIAPPVALGQNWTTENPAGKFSSEKFDGVRVFLKDGHLISRNGNEFLAPKWYRDELPNATLDGELWMHRGGFQETISVVRGKNSGDRWKKVFFMVFDYPDHAGTWLERQAELAKLVAGPPIGELTRLGARTFLVPQTKIENEGHMLQLLGKVLEKGGEGLMLADPFATYTPGRSYNLLKVKKFLTGRAIILGYTKGQGRHVGVVGALKVANDTVEFSVGSGLSDEDRRNPPPIGAAIEYRYFEVTKDGMPRFPTLIKIIY